MKEREGRCYNSSFCTFPCLLPGGPTVPSGLPPCQVCVVQVALSECCWPCHWENAGLSRLFRGWQGTHTSWHKGSAGQGPHSLVLSLMPSSFPMQAGLVFHGVGAAVAFLHIRSSHFRPVTSFCNPGRGAGEHREHHQPLGSSTACCQQCSFKSLKACKTSGYSTYEALCIRGAGSPQHRVTCRACFVLSQPLH